MFGLEEGGGGGRGILLCQERAEPVYPCQDGALRAGQTVLLVSGARGTSPHSMRGSLRRTSVTVLGKVFGRKNRRE